MCESIVNPRFASLAKNSVFSTEHCYWRGMDRRTILRGGTVRVYNFFKGFLDSRNSEMNSSLLYKRKKKKKTCFKEENSIPISFQIITISRVSRVKKIERQVFSRVSQFLAACCYVLSSIFPP